MTDTAQQRLEKLGLSLPTPVAPVANYVPYVQTGNLLVISGQVSLTADGTLITGQLGADVSLGRGVEAAVACGLNLLAQTNAALDGDLERVTRCVRLGGFVNATADFTDHPKVINGASDLMVAVLGDKGRHARFAVGAPSLPLGAAVEVDAMFELR
ncbi:MAG: RidA family protein [Alphaproteobacteria bacterium]